MAIKVCIDAGHYGKTNRSPGVKEYYESEMNWKLQNYLKSELEKYGIEVVLTRKDQATDLPLTERGNASKGCNLFLSLHSNAVGSGMNESTDYPVVIVQLDGKGDKLGQLLADKVTAVMGTKQAGRIWTRKGNNGEYYGVLRGAAAVGTMGMIIEHSFHTNTKATKWLLVDENLARLAKEEAAIIADYFGVKKATGEIWRVQVGAFINEQGAKDLLAKLKAAGFDGCIKSEQAAQTVTVPKKTVEELAKEVIDGKWGSGADRKNRLTEAGYDYSAVQKKVNELLK